MAYLIGLLRKLNFCVIVVIAVLLCCYYQLSWNYYQLTDLGITSKVGSKPSIFFLETSNRTNIEARAACSIESAALHHPDHDVIVRSNGTFSPTDLYVAVLRSLTNIRFLPLNPDDHFIGTPFEEWYSLCLIQQSKWPINQFSNALRLAILWREGGVYLDTDVIVLRPFGGLRNAVALQSAREANNAILVFDRSSQFLFRCMEDYIKEFRGDVWGHQGPRLITRNLQHYCNCTDLVEAVDNPSMCDGVTLLKQNSFYPIPATFWPKILHSTDDVNLSNSYAVHLWAKHSRNNATVPGNNTVLENLARNNCPLVYELMKLNGII